MNAQRPDDGQHAGHRQTRNHVVRGALVRNTWSAAGAWSGMMCVDWADCGLNGSPDAPHDVFGTIFQAPTEAEYLLCRTGAILGRAGRLHQTLCMLSKYTHSVAEAALGLRQEIANRPSQAWRQSMSKTHPLAVDLKNANPDTTLAAKFSVPHVVATALVSSAES